MCATASELGPARERGVERVEVEQPVVGDRHPGQLAAQQLPRDDVRVVLHLGEHHEVAGADVGPAPRVGDEVDRLGRVAGEDGLAGRRAGERGDLLARDLVGLGRLRRQRVHAAVDGGPVLVVVAVHRLDHRPRRLRRGGRVEIDEALLREDGELRRGGGREAQRRRRHLVADPAVAALLELADQLRAALLDDPPLEHDVHELRLDHVQDALVVRDDQDAHVGALGDGVHAGGDRVQRVDVQARVGLVEHGQARVQERELEDLHALLLAAAEPVVEVAVGELARDVASAPSRPRRSCGSP